MADTPKEHVLDKETGAHVATGSGDDGACLVSHIGVYKSSEYPSCSHRWQAYRHAEDHATMYNDPAYASLFNARAKGDRPPGANAWDLGVPSTVWRHDKTIGGAVQLTVPNFQERADVPYWHNAHHIIPNGVFNSCLLEAAGTDMRLFWLFRVGLLEAKYNLNDKPNMIILPMKKVIARGLGLPRHISGIDTEPGQSREQRNHSKYNDKVRVKVKEVITDYASQIDEQKHDAKLPAFTKTELTKISTRLFKSLQVWGKAAQGKAINAMPEKFF